MVYHRGIIRLLYSTLTQTKPAMKYEGGFVGEEVGKELFDETQHQLMSSISYSHLWSE